MGIKLKKIKISNKKFLIPLVGLILVLGLFQISPAAAQQCPAGTTCSSTIPQGYCVYGTCELPSSGFARQVCAPGTCNVCSGPNAFYYVGCSACVNCYCVKPCKPLVETESATPVIKYIGETATIIVTCSDSDSNLSNCGVASPCSNSCLASGSSGSCSCNYICTNVGTYDAHGIATDTSGQIGEKILTTALECRQANYPPTATNLYRDNPDWCINPFQFVLNWTFSDPDGDTQYAKQIQVDDNSSFTSIDHDSGKIENNEIPAYTTFMSDGKGGVLQFNKTYYWRLKLWDSKGGESDWIQSSETLVTPLHAYPDPDFTYQPQKVRELQSVQFTDESYSPVQIAKWYWTFQDGTPLVSTKQNPSAIFETPGSKTVALTVWDVDNYSCSGGDGTQVIPVSIFAPTWREIIPW